MHSYEQTDLLETIYKVFPNASIVRKSEQKPLAQDKSQTHEKPKLAKHAKPPRVVSRVSKHKVLPNNQLSLFDDERASI